MASATKLPTLSEITYVQLSRSDAPNPRLSAAISATATTIVFTNPLLGSDGTVIAEALLLGIRDQYSYVETVYIPAAGLSADGLTATGCVRGIRLDGLDWTTGDSTLAVSHKAGDAVFCNISGVIGALYTAAINGTIATGGVGFTMGTEGGAGNETITLYRTTTAGAKLGFLRWNHSGTEVEYSDNGSAWTAINDVSASDLVKVSATDTTPSYLATKLVSATGGIDFNTLGGGANETLNLTVDLSESGITGGTLAKICSDVTATMDEINQALDGISANVTDTNLNTLTAGASSDATALHTHTSVAQYRSATAYETITTDQAVALLPVEVEWYTQLTDANLALGDSNTRRKYAIKIIPTVTTSTLTTMQFRAAEAVNGATTLGNLTISIQPDSAGAPSGTAITNGTANVITQTTQRTWNTTQGSRTATWATPPTLTAGTTYWIVFEVAATDAANYLNIGVNSTYDENYLTFTRLTYDLDTTTWGGSATNATPFFWFNTQKKLLGMALCPTDADFGGRTWSFVGFAKAGGAAQASIDYYYEIVPDLSGLTPGADYYLSATAGAISTTVLGSWYDNNRTYKIGKALSTTELLIEPGEKRIFYASATITANTVEQFVLWFKPTMVSARGALGTVIDLGYYDGVNNKQSLGLGGGNYCLRGSDGAGQVMTVTGGGLTDIGFTMTLAETGTVTNWNYGFLAVG